MKSMCSPGGNATMNSLMKLETFLLEITVHSHSLTPRTLSGTLILRSPFTLHWHPSRQWSLICLRVKWGFSESRISPPPSSTCTLHCPHEALPPHAEGRKMPFSLRVVIRLEPCATLIVLSPLMVMLTLPLGERYFFATSRITTKRSIIMRKTPMLAPINCPILNPPYYNLSPLKHIIAIAMRPTVMNVMPSP